jgi:hypothetical protein
MRNEPSRPVYRVEGLFSELTFIRYLEAYRVSKAILNLPKPDTFPGCKTPEPFPLEDSDWRKLI